MAVTGGGTIARMLGDMPDKLRTGTIKRAAGSAAKVMAEEAALIAPREGGKPDMADTIGVSVSAPRGTVTARVRLKGPHSFLGQFMEFGVAPHLITSRTGKPLKVGDNLVEGPIYHPGHAPRAFLRPAFDTKAQAAIARFGEVLGTEARTRGYERAEPDSEDFEG